MSSIPDISADRLAASLHTSFLGRSLVAEDVLESTNLTAAELAPHSPEGLVVIADRQTGGRGRNGRTWTSPGQRSLYVSALFKPACPPACVPQLAIVTAMSIAEALGRLGTGGIQVKWPNDIWCKGRKLCGILCSMSCIGGQTEYAVVGFGINVNLQQSEIPEDLAAKATSLLLETGRRFDRAQVLAAVLDSLEGDYLLWLKHRNLVPFMERWAKTDLLYGHSITAEHGSGTLTGKACGIAADGRLRLKLEDREILIAAGDTHILNI